jgi:hypothetical protein
MAEVSGVVAEMRLENTGAKRVKTVFPTAQPKVALRTLVPGGMIRGVSG